MSSKPDVVTDGRAIRGEATRRRIVDAARDVLLERGHGGTSTRSVAEEAGVPLSLVHYHFGGKQGLLVAVLDRENTELLERQRELYAQPGPLADKWRTACDFLDEDIRSGFVRVLWELWAAGLADEDLAAGWRSAMGGWRSLLESVLTSWVDELQIELLAGVPDEDAPHREVLDAIGVLIERAEAKA